MTKIEHYTKLAKDTIKNRFGIDIAVELIKSENLPQRKAELEKQYGRKAEGLLGFFMPEANGLPPIILVGYSEDQPFSFIEIFHHELQHAIDYFEALENLGKEFIDANLRYFNYFTEYNASVEGNLHSTQATLSGIPVDLQRQFIADSKAHCMESFKEQPPRDLIDAFYRLSKIQEFAQVEGKHDLEMLETLPGSQLLADLANFMNHYEPTQEWYAEFKEKIDRLIKGGK